VLFRSPKNRIRFASHLLLEKLLLQLTFLQTKERESVRLCSTQRYRTLILKGQSKPPVEENHLSLSSWSSWWSSTPTNLSCLPHLIFQFPFDSPCDRNTSFVTALRTAAAAVPWFSLSPRRQRFDPRLAHLGFVVDKVVRRQAFPQSSLVFPVSIFLTFIYHRRCTILTTDIIVDNTLKVYSCHRFWKCKVEFQNYCRRNESLMIVTLTTTLINNLTNDCISEEYAIVIGLHVSQLDTLYCLIKTAVFRLILICLFRGFFLWRRAPQQNLRTHRSLKASCATLWWRWKMISFFIFTSNGAPVEWNWQGKTEVLGEKNLSQCHFVHHKSQMDWPGIEPGHPRWEAGD
jgi:hypothetical protein